MVTFPNAKINIGLHVTGKRDDGYHNIESIFYPVGICDILEIIQEDKDEFTTSGIKAGADSDNLCIKALNILRADFPSIGKVSMYLHKTIPTGAGLGGGSSDAAFCLKLLNTKFDLGLGEKQLMAYAATIGSDCAFFIKNTPSFATGRGEELVNTSIDLSAYKLLIVHPGLHVSTKEAFSKLQGCTKHTQLKEFIAEPITRWKDLIKNDFESSVFSIYPQISALKEQLYNDGAIYASMSGSGSSVYGIFEKTHQTDLNFPADYFFRWV